MILAKATTPAPLPEFPVNFKRINLDTTGAKVILCRLLSAIAVKIGEPPSCVHQS